MELTASTERGVSWTTRLWSFLLLVDVAGCGVSNAVITGSPVAGHAALPVGTGSGMSPSGGSNAGLVAGGVTAPRTTATGGTASGMAATTAGTASAAAVGAPSGMPTATAGAFSSAGGHAQAGVPGAAAGPVTGAPAASACRPSKYSLAVRLTIDVRWQETAALMGGAAKAQAWSKLTIEPSANTISEFRVCGTLMPISRTNPVAGNTMGFQRIPLATYDLPSMPTLSGGSATRVDSSLTLDPGSLVLGLMLPDPAAPWPASSSASNLMPVDADGDGKPGVTSLFRNDGAFSAPPTSILQTDHIDASYVASRLRYRATLNDPTCADALEGPAELLSLDILVLGCHVKDKQDCKPQELQFLEDARPNYVFATAAVISAAVIPVDATCAQVIQALDVPVP